MEDKDIFGILGIDNREDSYTNLVKHLFDNWIDFKINFCKLIAGYEDNNAVLLIRKVFDIEDGKQDKLRKILPDMILFSKEKNIVTMIENKIFSDEGHNQTKKYVNSANIIKENKLINLPTAYFINHKYITLDGNNPDSDNFRALKWSDLVIECCAEYKKLTDKKLCILVEDLYNRAFEYENCPMPKSDETFSSYLKNKKHWITPFSLNKRFMEAASINTLVYRDDFIVVPSYSHNRSGSQYLYLIYKKQWIKGDIENKNGINYNIHIESNWVEDSDKIKLAVHFETNPYKTQKELNGKYHDAKNEFDALRNKFKVEFHKRILNSKWICRNYPLAIADCVYDSKMPLSEFKKWYEKQIEIVVVAIDETINVIFT